jgi:hypothetical protein
MISIRTLYLLANFTYIFIDIFFYALKNTSWSSIIFWIVSRVVTDPCLDFLSPYRKIRSYAREKEIHATMKNNTRDGGGGVLQ